MYSVLEKIYRTKNHWLVLERESNHHHLHYYTGSTVSGNELVLNISRSHTQCDPPSTFQCTIGGGVGCGGAVHNPLKFVNLANHTPPPRRSENRKRRWGLVGY